MPTLPEEIADLADRFHKVCKTYKVKSIKLTQYMGKPGTSDTDQFTVEVVHPLGEVKLDHPGYFCMPGDSGKIAPALSVGISHLVERYKHELATARSDLQSAKDEIARCEESIERASGLDPGILDQIVSALD